jgi:hypothetical protein
MEMNSNERYRAGHFAIETPTVHAHRSVSFFLRETRHNFHIGALASTCHAVHNEHNRNVVILRQIV